MVRLGRLDVRLIDPKQRKLEKKKQKSGRELAEAMHSLGEEECSLEVELNKGRKIYGQFWEEVPELSGGEVIMTTVPDVSFFDDYVTNQVERGLSDNYGAMKQGFEHLLRAVGRRAPFEDFFAKEKGNYLSIKNSVGGSLQRVEANQIASFKGELSAAIEQARDLEILTGEVRWLIGKYNQLLPYTLRTVFFADNENSPNFGRQIQEKFDAGARRSISEYVRQNTNEPIFTMLKLITIDETGRIADHVLGKDSAQVEAAHYLAAANYFEIVKNKITEAEKLQAALEKRIDEGKIKMADLDKGVSFYLEHIIGNPAYRATVERVGRDFALKTDNIEQVVAAVVVADRRFTNVLIKSASDHKKAGAKVSGCNEFKFHYL